MCAGLEARIEGAIHVSAHSFCRRQTTAMFDMIIFNLGVGSYMRMMTEKALSDAEKDKKDKSL